MVEIKGAVIKDAINDVKNRNGDQVYNTIISQLDEQTRQLFKKPISDTGWYPLDLFVKFIELNIKLTANGDENEYLNRVGAIIEKQLTGIYKIFFKSGSPDVFIKNVSITHQGFFRGVSVKATFDGPNKVIIRYTGFEK